MPSRPVGVPAGPSQYLEAGPGFASLGNL